MRAWLVEKWDWFVYRRAWHSIRRMCERNHGFAYLFELWIREWRSKHPISPELERATELFFEAQRDAVEAKEAGYCDEAKARLSSQNAQERPR